MSKKKKVSEAFQYAAKAAREELMNAIAATVVATDPLTEEELRWLKEAENLTPEERAEILKEVGDDPWGNS